MTNDSLEATIVNLFTTYLLHSTLFLAPVALVLWFGRPASHALVERIWKSAAILPLVTTLLPWWGGFAHPIYTWNWVAATPAGTVPQIADASRPLLPTPPVVRRDPPVGISSLSLDEATPPAFESSELRSVVPLPSAVVTSPLPESTVAFEPSFETGIETSPPLPPHNIDRAPAETSLSLPLMSMSEPPPAADTRIVRWIALSVAAIVCVGLARCGLVSWQLRRRLRGCRVIHGGLVHDVFQSLRGTCSRRRVRLLQSHSFAEPVALGLFRWTIIVPSGIEERLTAAELKSLLAHELAHLIRGDAWWLLFGRLLCYGLPFQPLNVLARRCWQEAAEYQCDDWAVGRTSDPLTLARCLTKVAEWNLGKRSQAHASAAGGARSTLSNRVERLLAARLAVDPWTKFRRRLACSVVIVAVAVLVSWRGPRTVLRAESVDPSAEREATQDEIASTSGAARRRSDTVSDALRALDSELRQLEHDIQKANALLRETEYPDHVEQVIRRIETRSNSLEAKRQRFATLAAANPSGTPVTPPEAGIDE